ncbi:MAG: hypothetical protein FJX76_05990 [Armatimonadetes bacterium]|nr:hypothetical protein [Armatimonadota bacterium]
MWTIGSRVKHPFLGPGSVLEIQRGGRVVRVCFDNKPQVAWLVVASELEVATEPEGISAVMSILARGQAVAQSQPEPLPKRRPTPPPSSLLPEESIAPIPACPSVTEAQALHAIEALRLGVVPRHLIETYTVGREKEIALVRQDLEETLSQGAFRIIMGDYGTGKTHHLEYVEQVALARNFVTARVTLDARETPPSMPKRVYRRAVRALRYPDRPGNEEGGLAPLFDRILGNPDLTEELLKVDGETYHKYLSPALAYYKDLRALDSQRSLVETLFDWVEGHPTVSNVILDQRLKHEGKKYHRLYALMDYCPWSHIYAYLLGGISTLARRAGYNGLVLLLDEAEFYSLLSGGHAYYAAVLFSYYATAAMGPGRCKVNVDDLPRGGHPVHRAIPAMYAEQQHLYVTFAITPDSSGLEVLRGLVGPEAHTGLSEFDGTNYRELAARVWGLYHRAYPEFEGPGEAFTRLGDMLYRAISWGRLGNLRQALKLLVEMADYMRHVPHKAPALLDRWEEALGAVSPRFS